MSQEEVILKGVQKQARDQRYTPAEACEFYLIFFFQAEDGIRDLTVTGVQTCALPISNHAASCTPANEASQCRAVSVPARRWVRLDSRSRSSTSHFRPSRTRAGQTGCRVRSQ